MFLHMLRCKQMINCISPGRFGLVFQGIACRGHLNVQSQASCWPQFSAEVLPEQRFLGAREPLGLPFSFLFGRKDRKKVEM